MARKPGTIGQGSAGARERGSAGARERGSAGARERGSAGAHEANRILYADDCLNVLNDPLALPPGSVDLIYLDPPFNSKSDYNLPFKGKYKSAKPVAAFTDTWRWGEAQDAAYSRFEAGPATRPIAQLIDVVRRLEGPGTQYRLDAYLVNMAERLIAMRSVLKPTGSIYLHCDRTAAHYLKALMDLIFGKHNFRNEIIWCYTGPSNTKRWFPQKHDNIFWYSMGDEWTFNWESIRVPYVKLETGETSGIFKQAATLDPAGKVPEDWWPNFSPVGRIERERLGYPTQKPLSLLERIITASSNPGDLVLDPFCGCGTTLHAAHDLGRRWIGIDVARFAVGLVRNRLVSNFRHGNRQLGHSDIRILGIPETPHEARQLADRNKFEFEKWACGHVGAEGMFHDPGTKGADGGVDGVLKFFPLEKKPKPHYAIVQVKGGGVTPDAVRALDSTVRRFDAKAGVLICFEDQMRTVENNRSKETFTDGTSLTERREFPVIQGLSVEDMLLRGRQPNLPNIMKMAA